MEKSENKNFLPNFTLDKNVVKCETSFSLSLLAFHIAFQNASCNISLLFTTEEERFVCEFLLRRRQA